MITNRTFACFVGSLLLAVDTAAVRAEDCADGVCFSDRGATGEITLGAFAGGLGVIDFDRDGFMDLVIADRAGRTNRLFHNITDPNDQSRRTFEDVTMGSGLDDADGTDRDGIGVLIADYDNDGFDDIYFVGRQNSSGTFGLLYHNDGDGTFSNVSGSSGLRRSGGGAESASWCDYDLDGRVDLLVTFTASPWIRIYRNNGDGTFADVSDALPTVAGFSHSYSNAWMDYDGDGYPDNFILSNGGTGHDVLLHNISDGNGGRRFENVAASVGYVDQGPSPMGIAFGDFDGDGDFDIGISDAGEGTFYENTGGAFKRFQPAKTMFGWGVDWLDANNDGALDFYTAGSWSRAAYDNLQLNTGDGTLVDRSANLNGVSAASRFCVQLDFNNDGAQDLITIVPDNFVSTYENISDNQNSWTSISLVGDGHWMNRDAIGAVVRVKAGGRTQMRQVNSGSSTTATEDLRLHFGLGDTDVIDSIEVIWPRGGGSASRTDDFEGPFAVNMAIALAPTAHLGDLNCDGTVNFDDIDSFVTALASPVDYAQSYPDCFIGFADLNDDGAVDFADIDPFVLRLTR